MNARDRAIARLAVPALGSLAVEPLYILVDTAIVGRLGTEPLAGLALAATVLNVAFFVFNFLAYGTTARVAFLSGRGRPRAAASTAVQGLYAAGLLGAVGTAVLLFAGPGILAALGGRDDVLVAGTTYLRISAVGIPFVLVALVGHGYLRGLQDTRTPLAVVATTNALNLAVELWLVFGLDLGIAGSAWSTVLAQGVAAGWFGVLIGRRVRRANAPLRPDRIELRRLATSGRQLVVRTAALLAVLTLATSTAARIGDATLAAHQIALQVWTFLALAVDALAIAGQALAGSALGAGDLDEAWAASRRLLRIGLVLGVLLGAAVVAASPVLPRAFTTDAAVLDRASVALAIVGATQPVAAVVFVLDGVLIGSGDHRFLQYAMLVALAAFVAADVVVLRTPQLGIAGLWTALAAWTVVRMATVVGRFVRGSWARAALAAP